MSQSNREIFQNKWDNKFGAYYGIIYFCADFLIEIEFP